MIRQPRRSMPACTRGSWWTRLGILVGVLGVLAGAGCKPEGSADLAMPPAAISDGGGAGAAADSPYASGQDGVDPRQGQGEGPEATGPAANANPDADAGEVAGAGSAGGPEVVADAAQPATSPDEDDATADQPATAGELKLLILGDSLAATGFGVLLQKRLDAHPKLRAFRKGKSASGLARPDYFDWMAEARRQIELRQPDIVVVIMGGNDGQDLTPAKSGGRRVNWQTGGWDQAYTDRMEAFLAAIAAPGRKIVWLGLPHMELRSLERKLETIRALQRAAVEQHAPDAVYIDTTTLLAGEDGVWPKDVRSQGRMGKLREDDGIHFTMHGSQYFADRVYPAVVDAAGLK